MKHTVVKNFQKPIIGNVHIPGSKSITNRALLLASLTTGTVEIKNPLICDDTLAMMNCLKTLGIQIEKKQTTYKIIGNIFNSQEKNVVLDADLSGTTLRFLLPFLCITDGEKILTGKEGLLKRPIGHLVESLRALGAYITYLGEAGYPPLLIKKSELKAKTVEIKGHLSSQYLSSILMLLPYIKAEKIKVTSSLVSKPYIDVTLEIMKDFGVEVKNKEYKQFIKINNSVYTRKKPYFVEGDLSSACYFAALAVLTGSKITLKNVNHRSFQADKKFFDILKQMGNTVIAKNNAVVVSGNSIKPLTVNMESCPDQVQTLAVLASFAKGKTLLSGIQTLRVKETDRVHALVTELSKMGIRTSVTQKTLTIFGGNHKPVEVDTYGDHRMAMSFALIGARIPGIVIKDPNVVSKTFPDFWSNLENLGV